MSILIKVSYDNARVAFVEDLEEDDHAENKKQLLDVRDEYLSCNNDPVWIDVKKFVSDIASTITKPDAIGVGTKLDEYKHLFQRFH